MGVTGCAFHNCWTMLHWQGVSTVTGSSQLPLVWPDVLHLHAAALKQTAVDWLRASLTYCGSAGGQPYEKHQVGDQVPRLHKVLCGSADCLMWTCTAHLPLVIGLIPQQLLYLLKSSMPMMQPCSGCPQALLIAR